MRRYISFPKIEGLSSRQAHADLPAGTYERELGKEGFFGPSTHMYHQHPPTGWVSIEGELKPRAFDLLQLPDNSDCPFAAPIILHNPHITVQFWQSRHSMQHLARNGDGDLLLFIHQGMADLFCDYGHLRVEAGDYIMLPRSTMWRLEHQESVSILMIEATNGSYLLPDKGLLGDHAIFDPALLDTPHIDEAFKAQQKTGEWCKQTIVKVKRRGAITTLTYPFNPLDCVGWHGNLAVVRINVRDIRPLMSHRYHLPPSAHTTFVAPRFVICTFVPRPFETDPAALKVPFFHNNDDYDEVLFYHAGQFFSRDHIKPGMMTLHPCGLTHGPHPKALAGMFQPKAAATDEVAVMIDTRDALEVPNLVEGVELMAYVDSWKGSQ
ncbi:MAG: homogentisate 1,2-dioxygenase [Alphaproteobacteria bacterium]